MNTLWYAIGYVVIGLITLLVILLKDRGRQHVSSQEERLEFAFWCVLIWPAVCLAVIVRFMVLHINKEDK